MLCTVRTSQQTAIEVARLLDMYGLTLDDFLRANLDFLGVALPSISNLAAQTQGAKPKFTDDIYAAVLPCLKAQAEFRRVGAHIDDTIIRLRAQRLGVECMRANHGARPNTLAAAPRRIQGLVNPCTYLSEDEQILAPFELEQVRTIGDRLGLPHLYFPGAVRGSATLGHPLDLNDGMRSIPTMRGVELLRTDIDRWLTLLQYYGLVPLGLNLGQVIKSDEGAAIITGFASLLSDLTEAVCFFFACNQDLAEVSYREDLIAIQERGQRLAAAWERAHLEVEVLIHRLNGHSEIMVPALLLLASGVAAGEDIFGEQGTAREATDEAPENRMTPSPVKIKSIPAIPADYR